MKELSLHILDIANNSVTAGACLVEITVDEDTKSNLLTITVNDNGSGMSKELLLKVRDPFTTSRTTRPVGMGIPLFELAAKSCGGGFDIKSELGIGTTVIAVFMHNHIDRQPLGDMASTVTTLISGNPQIDFVYRHIINGKKFELDTSKVKEILLEVPIDSFEVISWIRDYINEGLNTIRGL